MHSIVDSQQIRPQKTYRWLFLCLGLVIGALVCGVFSIVASAEIRTNMISVDNSAMPVVTVRESLSLLGKSQGYEVWLGPHEHRGVVIKFPSGWGYTPEIIRSSNGIELKFDKGTISIPRSAYPWMWNE